MKYILEFLHFFGSILLANIEVKFPKIYSFMYSILVGFFEIKLICFFNKIILILKYLIKFSLFSIVFLTFLVLFVNFSEFVILLVLNFTIGLKESFSNATTENKLYLIDLYIFLAYSFVKRKDASLRIYNYIGTLRNKYFDSKNKENVEKYKSVILFFCVYAFICFVGLIFYKINGHGWNAGNKGDIINIFIWATYLIAPLVVIWAFSDWRNVHNKQVEKDLSISSYNKMDEVVDLIHGIYFSLRRLKNARFDEIDIVNFKIVEDNCALLKEKHTLLISSLNLTGYLSVEIEGEKKEIDFLSEIYSTEFHKYTKNSKNLMEEIRKKYNRMRDDEDFIYNADINILKTVLYSKIEDRFDKVSSAVVGSEFFKEFDELDQTHKQLSINSQFILDSIKTGIFVK
ncbi:hypothetical protein F4W09_02465 [Acinetobacter tandoii]|uniref:Uncharacterized protein n=1 Tax=Acinetobacter tandoii TaxID=202954 RepID=A0A5N4WTI0_9GAMM|nr:hypothetical protein [Acinetobacter tandoii]KAB1860002.1 hypothetical protein F4W09_02465 [Acinetobacter tandoii]